jgi:hypothetical protein
MTKRILHLPTASRGAVAAAGEQTSDTHPAAAPIGYDTLAEALAAIAELQLRSER